MTSRVRVVPVHGVIWQCAHGAPLANFLCVAVCVALSLIMCERCSLQAATALRTTTRKLPNKLNALQNIAHMNTLTMKQNSTYALP